MHDLRKKALLESGKTTSRRKERNLQVNSGLSTPVTSRAASAATSRDASDEENEYGNSSLESIGELVASLPTEVWTKDLDERIESICDRKRSSTEGREEALNAFCNIITHHYAQEQLRSHIAALLPALLKSVKSGDSTRETELALRALSMLMATEPSQEIHEFAHAIVKAAIEDSGSNEAKIAAIHALSTLEFFSESEPEQTEETMDFFLDIVSTDGVSVGADDNADVVLAALEEWGLLATQFDELPASADTAMDTFIDQLESSYTTIVSTAAENIALLVEMNHAETASDDESEDGSGEDDVGDQAPEREDDDAAPAPESTPKDSALDGQAHRALTILESLSKQSVKRVAKKDRRDLHSSLADVENTIRNPTRGPGAMGVRGGSRLKVSVDKSGSKVIIDKWWKLSRVSALKRLFRTGFMVHYELNPHVPDMLPAPVIGHVTHTDSGTRRETSRQMEEMMF